MRVLKPFSLLIKPASAACNIRCEYCFYIDHLNFLKEGDKPVMSESTFEKLIAGYMKLPLSEYSFGWQGGEPTIMGLNFLKK